MVFSRLLSSPPTGALPAGATGPRRGFPPVFSRRPLTNALHCEQFSCLVATCRKKGKALRAVERSSNYGGEADDEDDDLDATDEAFRATIRKSKKVLEMQRNLLQQIDERRKLVSSMKDSVLNKKQEPSVNDSRRSSFSKDMHSNFDEIHDEKFQDNVEKPQNDSFVELAVADALSLFEENSLETETTYPQISPPIVPEISESYAMKDEINGSIDSNFPTVSEQQEMPVDEGNMDSSPLAGANVMNVIIVAAECAPWWKTGGLGDVVAALPKALARRGHRVMVVVPKYENHAEFQQVGDLRRYKVAGQDMEVSYFHSFIDGVDFVFIDSPMFRHIGNNIYGGSRQDVLKRMALFCKAAVEVPWHVPCGGVCYGDGNLVFIANDWHTALLPVYLKAYYHDNGIMTYTRSVLVIHNIAHQGRGPVEDFTCVDLPEHHLELFRHYDPVGGEHLNIFKAGLKTAHRVVAVSHGYAWEIRTPEGGWGLHEIINENDWKFQGIVNGIDTNDWNPKLDSHLRSDGYTNYCLESLQTGKPQCKAALQQELGLPVRDEVPLIGFIGRLDHQKGIDIIADAIPWIVGQDVQLVMLGTGRHDLENMLRRFEHQHRDKVRSWVGFSVKMAHRITAGADVLLMPSRFEPCGLNQLYAMMYGTIPVVHSVGGLRDTVHEFDPFNEAGHGWTFDRAEANRMINALGHCLNTYRNYRSSWEGLQKRGMTQDLSWDNAARHYEEVLVTAKYQW